MIKKANEDFYLKVNTTRDYYNKPELFSGVIVWDSNSDETSMNSFSEIILPHNGHSADILTANAGNTKFVVQNNTLLQGDVFVHNDVYYYIKNVKNNNILLFKPLEDSMTGTIYQVGNTGIYKCLVNIPSPGDYSLIITNPDFFDNNKISTVQIIKEDVTDAHAKLDALQNEVDDMSDTRNYIAFV